MKTGRYSGLAACGVLLLAAILMLGRFALSERSFVPVTALPASQITAGYGTVETEGRVNINTAGPEELDTLPGIGPVKAAAIIAFREEHGPFRYPEDLIRVKGIGEGTLEKLMDLITTGGGRYAENLSG